MENLQRLARRARRRLAGLSRSPRFVPVEWSVAVGSPGWELLAASSLQEISSATCLTFFPALELYFLNLDEKQ